MDEVEELRQRLARVEALLARLEAKEEVLATFNSYTYLMDVGHAAELVDRVFAADAELHLVNFPPGTMTDSTLHGDEIRALYADHTRWEAAVRGGHHTTNVGVAVDDDLGSAELSAYFLTSTARGVQGGQYRVRLRPDDDGRWRVTGMQIVSGWGWHTATDATTEAVPAGKVWAGARPVRWSG